MLRCSGGRMTARTSGDSSRSDRGAARHAYSKLTRVPPVGSGSSAYVPLARRRPPAPTLCSTILAGGALATVSMKIQSVLPATLVWTVARAPTPRSGPRRTSFAV